MQKCHGWNGGGPLMNKVIVICLSLGASLQISSAILVTLLKVEIMTLTNISTNFWGEQEGSVATTFD